MIAQLHIQVAKRNECSYLKKAFFATPFKVMNITEDKTGNQLHLMLMSSSPGILDGDENNIKIEVEQNCSLQLHTQAYQRLFNMKAGATQQMDVHLSDGASFCYLPHPSVPHEQSIFNNSNNFYLSNNCQLIFGEILTCGRKLNGELFLFSKYHSISNIYFNHKLVIKENMLMQPSLINVYAIGQLEGYTHQASMIFLNQHAGVKNIRQLLTDLLSKEKNIEAGITAVPANGLLIRLLGNGAEQLYDCLLGIQKLLQTNAAANACISTV